jgi:intein/homing endonuclease
MANGETKPIEEVRVGDTVVCYNIPDLPKDTEGYLSCSFKDVSRHTFTTRKVIANKVGQEPMYFLINKKIRVTHEHPFFVRIGNAWRYVEAQNLRKGYRMLGPDGEIAIRSVEPIFDTVVQTFNLTVEDANSFIAEGVVVHNVGDTKTVVTNPGGGTATGVTPGGGTQFFGYDDGSSGYA